MESVCRERERSVCNDKDRVCGEIEREYAWKEKEK